LLPRNNFQDGAVLIAECLRVMKYVSVCGCFSGNSQYHYYGIRIKSMSPLNQVGCDGLLMSRQHVFSQAKRYVIYSIASDQMPIVISLFKICDHARDMYK